MPSFRLDSPTFFENIYKEMNAHPFFLLGHNENETKVAFQPKKGNFKFLTIIKSLFCCCCCKRTYDLRESCQLILNKLRHSASLSISELDSAFKVIAVLRNKAFRFAQKHTLYRNWQQSIHKSLNAEEQHIINQLAIKKGRSPSFIACEKGMMSYAAQSVKPDEDISHLKPFLPHLVKELVHYQQVDQALLFIGADSNSLSLLSQEGKSELFFYAFQKGMYKEARILAQYGADILQKDKDGKTLLYREIRSRKKDQALFLIDIYTNLSQIFAGGHTYLHFATAYCLPQCVEKLIAKGVKVNAQDENGETPLHIASSYGFKRICKALLDNGGDIGIQNSNHEAPFHKIFTSKLWKKGGEQEEQIRSFLLYILGPYIDNLPDALAVVRTEDPQTILSYFREKGYMFKNYRNKLGQRMNPLQVPFLLQDRLITISVAAEFTQTQFEEAFELLKKGSLGKQAAIDHFSFFPYEVDMTHITLSSAAHLSVEHPFPFQTFINLFNTTASKEYYKEKLWCGKTTEQVKVELLRLASLFENNIFFSGMSSEPEVRKTEYQQLLLLLNPVIEHISSHSTEEKARLLEKTVKKLLKLYGTCKGMYFDTFRSLYINICRKKGGESEFIDQLDFTLADYREIGLRSFVPRKLGFGQEVNDWNNFLVFAEQLGLPLAKLSNKFKERFGSVLSKKQQEKIYRRFFEEFYLPYSIVVEWLEPQLHYSSPQKKNKESSHTLRSSFQDYCKSLTPRDWADHIFRPIYNTVQRMKIAEKSDREIALYLQREGIPTQDKLEKKPQQAYPSLFLDEEENENWPELCIEEARKAHFLQEKIQDPMTYNVKRSELIQILQHLRVFKSIFAEERRACDEPSLAETDFGRRLCAAVSGLTSFLR